VNSKNKKKNPSKLTVEDSKDDDNTIVLITEKRMEELNIMKGDQVLLKGKLAQIRLISV
jgi:formylmethanofuran dehydrogenase subunit D